MTVKELIQSQPEETVVAALCERFRVRAEDREQAEEALTRFVRSLDPIEPVGERDLILGILRTSEEGEFLEPCLYRKAEIAAKFHIEPELEELSGLEGLSEEEIERLAYLDPLPDSYAFEYAPWNEVLGCEVYLPNAREVGETALCAAVLWEMSFFGLEESRVERAREQLHEAVQEAEEERNKSFVSLEELCESLGIPRQTEEEKRKSHLRLCREQLTNRLRTYRVLRQYTGKNKGQRQ